MPPRRANGGNARAGEAAGEGGDEKSQLLLAVEEFTMSQVAFNTKVKAPYGLLMAMGVERASAMRVLAQLAIQLEVGGMSPEAFEMPAAVSEAQGLLELLLESDTLTFHPVFTSGELGESAFAGSTRPDAPPPQYTRAR